MFSNQRKGLALLELILVLSVGVIMFLAAYTMQNKMANSPSIVVTEIQNTSIEKNTDFFFKDLALVFIKGLLIVFLLYIAIVFMFSWDETDEDEEDEDEVIHNESSETLLLGVDLENNSSIKKDSVTTKGKRKINV